MVADLFAFDEKKLVLNILTPSQFSAADPGWELYLKVQFPCQNEHIRIKLDNQHVTLYELIPSHGLIDPRPDVIPKTKMKKKTSENKQGSEAALKILDSLLKDAGQKKINENQIIVILDALASADDAEVVARFPAVLAICARRGLELNSQTLFSRYWEASPKRQNLEKLLLVSAAIFKLQGLKPPGNLNKIAASLKPKFGDLLPAGEFQLSSGMNISVQALENTLMGHLSGYSQSQAHRAKSHQTRKKTLEVYMDRLFSPKQKELVYKKRDGQTLTKTEREYYSRIVRKKLEAIASDDMVEIAKNLMTKTGKS